MISPITSPDVVSVSQYLDRVNVTLKSERAKIVGEVSGLKAHQNGHFYFSLLDKADQSKIECVIWRSNYRLFGVELSDGLEIIITTTPSIYKPQGRLSFPVDTVELVGEGALQVAYEALKKKLELEGIFAESRKRALPDYPHRIGVITSKSGAVIHDFLGNIGKFGYEIIFVDSKVEGQDAIKDLLSAVETLSTKNIDVLVVMRGGGSLESFLAFNNEVLVRKLASFPTPVITGIGHDKDVPLVSLVSDKNVSTPTAVANLLNASWNTALASVVLSEQKLFSRFDTVLREKLFFLENSEVTMERRFVNFLEIFKKAEMTLHHTLQAIELHIQTKSQMISQYDKEMSRGFENILRRVGDAVEQSEKTITLGDPTRQLSRGYSIARTHGKIVRNKKDVHIGDKLELLVSDGTIQSTVI